MKICAHQIVKKSEIEKKKPGPLSGRETFVEYFIFRKTAVALIDFRT